MPPKQLLPGMIHDSLKDRQACPELKSFLGQIYPCEVFASGHTPSYPGKLLRHPHTPPPSFVERLTTIPSTSVYGPSAHLVSPQHFSWPPSRIDHELISFSEYSITIVVMSAAVQQPAASQHGLNNSNNYRQITCEEDIALTSCYSSSTLNTNLHYDWSLYY